MTLGDVLAEFESNPNITLDDQFIRERTQAVANIKAALEEKRLHEASLDQTSKTLLVNKARLSQIKEDYTAKVKELKAQKRNEFRRIYADINRFRAEMVEVGAEDGVFPRRLQQGTGNQGNASLRETQQCADGVGVGAVGFQEGAGAAPR
jgi:hypothetical protein